jgi:uncharacterized protein DUF1877
MSMISVLTMVSDDEIRALHDSPENIDNVTGENRNSIDLDKAWQGVHWLLTGTDFGGEPPLCYIVTGGEEVSFTDFCYGPPRTLTSKQVAEWDDALSKISEDELAKRFDATAMLAADIYPSIWEESDSLDYLMDGYRNLKEFVARAKQENSGMIVYLT